MAYEIIIKPSAEKAFGKLPKALQGKILEALEQLCVNPRPSGVKKLKSTFNFYRIRVGEYRVIYSINDTVLIVAVVKIAHRKDVYR
jgi:mRNA interferase RelE/StbE